MTKKTKLITLGHMAILFILLFSTTAQGEVKGIEILYRRLFAEGMSFGNVGSYEVIKGRLYFEIDPKDPSNAAIVDLQYAPKNSKGWVEFSGEFVLIKPLDLDKGNHRLLYDVNNRGNLVMLGVMNDAPFSNLPSTPEHAGNGFLMREGYSLLWNAWNWDVIPGNDRLQMNVPMATDNGRPITQKIAAEIVTSFESEPISSKPLAWGNSRCYPPADPFNKSAAQLTVRDEPRGKRTPIPRDQWEFGRREKDQLVPDPTWLYLKTGFQPGKIYELIYTVKNPRIVGLGLASVRDTLTFFRYEIKDQYGRLNPLAVRNPDGTLKPDPEKAYIFGVSQSGRFITHMIFQGFHVNKHGQMVFDGARIHVAGGGKGGFNHRFSQTTHHPSDLEGNYMPADFFPFNYAPQTDPITGKTGDVLAKAKELGNIPYIMITNNELEYWTRSASLIHTDVLGKKDALLHSKVRLYVTCSAPHRNARSRDRGIYEHSINPLNHYPISRALLRALDLWVTKGIEPPESQYPRIDKGELITAKEHKKRFPKIPGMRHPGRNLKPPRVDYGPQFWTHGIFSIVPPKMKEPYQTLVPAFDKDGNGIGGIRLPELRVPLGTYQGWNPRRAEYGEPGYLGRFEGSFWPFALTEKEREKTSDPRPAIETRYPTKEVYVEKIKEAVQQLMKEGFMLKEDADRYIKRAEATAWPPQMIPEYPFWKQESP
ncbi:MAG: hypothetical protein JSV88_33910 [Candidatus Aminicenantes bacterium]|nr:MAG: hypothetical protein JSV88_33910 [Candidatus Aminicenantes bacterium]